jgi:alkylation response protein AidB-like acyl-CoA dehydrogenase
MKSRGGAHSVLAGQKHISLGITEPGGGSDVASLRTTAVRDGDHFVVNGSKTYITGGMRAELGVHGGTHGRRRGRRRVDAADSHGRRGLLAHGAGPQAGLVGVGHGHPALR